MKYGDECIPGRWGYNTKYTVWIDGSKRRELEPGDIFFVSDGNFWCYCIRPIFGNKIGRIVSYEPSCYMDYFKLEITKITEYSVFFKHNYFTIEYRKNPNGSLSHLSYNKVGNTTFCVSKRDFVRIAERAPYGTHFPYEEVEYKTFCPLKDATSFRFRMDPIESPYSNDWLAYGRKYWNYGMSKKGLCYSSFKKNEDTQLLNDESELTIKFKDNKLTRNHRSWFCYDYEAKRDPHKRSWKENTKKRHQYEVNRSK